LLGIGILVDQVVALKGRQEAVCGRLVDAELACQVGDAELSTGLGEKVEDGEAAVEVLDRVVAHRETDAHDPTPLYPGAWAIDKQAQSPCGVHRVRRRLRAEGTTHLYIRAAPDRREGRICAGAEFRAARTPASPQNLPRRLRRVRVRDVEH